MNFEDAIDFENPIDALDKFEKYLYIYEILLTKWKNDLYYEGYSLTRIKRVVQYSFGIDEFFEGTDALIKSFNMYYAEKMIKSTDKDFNKHIRDRFYALCGTSNSLDEAAKEIQESDAVKACRLWILGDGKYEWYPTSTYQDWNELMRRTYDLYRESIDAFIQSKMRNRIKSLRARILRERKAEKESDK